jgi:hypothetical protein
MYLNTIMCLNTYDINCKFYGRQQRSNAMGTNTRQ